MPDSGADFISFHHHAFMIDRLLTLTVVSSSDFGSATDDIHPCERCSSSESSSTHIIDLYLFHRPYCNFLVSVLSKCFFWIFTGITRGSHFAAATVRELDIFPAITCQALPVASKDPRQPPKMPDPKISVRIKKNSGWFPRFLSGFCLRPRRGHIFIRTWDQAYGKTAKNRRIIEIFVPGS